ncbi:MAG: tyrosine--tRNA ligase, partial [Coriobacteriales bacterium]|nr:tyrosine--tRNA ligase [Coriobacteriales bacterium]
DALPEDIPEFAGLLVENDKGLVYLPGLLASSALHFTNSNGDARKLIDGGGVKVGGEVVSDYELDPAALKGQVIQVGKRKFAKLM